MSAAMRRGFLAMGLLGPLGLEAALAQQTIVGTWAASPETCRGAGGDRVRIGPRSIASDELNCQFAGVSRRGDAVIWRGHCFSGEGSRRPPSPANDGEMTATLQGAELYLTGLGFEVGPLRRCSR